MVTAAVSQHSTRISIPDMNVAETLASPNQCQLVWVSPGLCPVATSETLHSALGLEAALSAKSKASVSQCPQISCERNSQRIQQGPEVMLRLTHTHTHHGHGLFLILWKKNSQCSASHLSPGSRRRFSVYILDIRMKLSELTTHCHFCSLYYQPNTSLPLKLIDLLEQKKSSFALISLLSLYLISYKHSLQLATIMTLYCRQSSFVVVDNQGSSIYSKC